MPEEVTFGSARLYRSRMTRYCDPFDEQAIDWLQRWARPSIGHLMLLVDGVFIPGLADDLPSRIESWYLFQHSESASEVRRHSPFVLELEDASDSWLEPFLGRCSGLPMITAFQTPESPAGLAARLARWCTVRVERDLLNLRFPDTRRLPDIVGVVDDAQLRSFIGPTLQWACIGRDGKWRSLRTLPTEVVEPEPAQFETPSLTPIQFATLLRAGEVDAVMAAACLRDPAWNDGSLYAHSTRHALARSALEILQGSSDTDETLDSQVAAVVQRWEEHWPRAQGTAP